ncbi:CHAT domain containing protein [Lactarius tabidus]
MIAESLFFLAVSLLLRLRVSKEPEDAISAAKCFRLLRDPAHPPFTFSRQKVTAYLVETLAFQMELKASDVIQTLEEMAALTHELLTSDPSCDNTNRAIADFVSAALTNKLPDPFPDEPLNQIIACLRLARVHKPELREVHFYLAICLTVRYFNTQVDDDYEEAMSIMDETIISNLPGDIFVAGCQTIAPWLAMTRFENPENLEERRFQYFGPIDGLEASSSDFQPPLPSELADDSDLSRKRQLLNGLVSGIRNNDITDIDVAIKSGRTILASSDPSHHTQDLHEVAELIPQCLNDGSDFFGPLYRFDIACRWADAARRSRHPSISTAYETAFSLMPDTLFLAPTVQLQHATFAKYRHWHSTMPLDYASYQVDLGQLEEAIETLERGRALLWSEMRHLRDSIDTLQQVDPQLGDKFAVVSRELEELTKSIAPSHKLNMYDDRADDVRAVDQFGRVVLKQRGLLKERDKLICQIRALPGFDRFLTSPSFDTLRSAASSGPIIIINHSKWRSDIIILLHNASPSLIPTPADFYRLPQQSRIWWCPTSVFCSIPLHAMGPVPSDDGKLRYFLDLYVPSYTPSLSALIQSRNRDSGWRYSGRPSVLLVAQTDPSLPTVGGEIQVVRALDTKVTSLISEVATPAAVIDGFRHHRFVRFACHGTLEAGKPSEAGFELHGGERLTLLEIVRSHLPTAEFAFLSACHTAEVTEGSIMDEGLHLAAAVQYSGFRSVVGTMWAMMDEDGPDLAENFYKALFSNSRRDEGRPYHERAAKALRYAVKKLRRKRYITLERWVNFVHYGA